MNQQEDKEENFRRKTSIFHKLMLHAILLILITVGINTYFTVKREYKVLTKGLIGTGKQIVANLGSSAQSAFWSLNWIFVEDILKEFDKTGENQVIYSKLVKPNGEVYLANNEKYYGETVSPYLLFSKETLLNDYVFSETKETGLLLVRPTPIGNETWYILLGLSLAGVKETTRGLIFDSVAWSILIVALGAVGSFFLSKSISSPIIDLAKAAEIISGGNRDHEVKVKSRDEVGLLGHSFNRMIRSLKQTEKKLQMAHEELEKRVEERTVELAKANKELQAEISERKQAEEALREGEEKYRNLIERANDGIVIVQDGRIQYINPRLAETTGYTVEELTGSYFADYFTREEALKAIDRYRRRILGEDVIPIYETKIVHKKGNVIDVELNAGIINYQGKPADLAILRDITDRKRLEKERKRLETQLQRADKMEAIGTLAGGVAHDLNNILSGIVSYPELLLMELPEDSPIRNTIITIQKSGEKAAAIVQDLLTLARRGVAVTEVVDINNIISEYLKSPEYEKLRMFHLDIHTEINLERNILPVLGSPVHLSKTLMNLVSNAAEAMPGGGTILISTKNRYIDRPVKGYDQVVEGDYVILSVSDNGVGISLGDTERIFEPFYTKKMMGRSGTGLGMSVVWGTVKDHRGYIDVQSAEGRGSTFKLYFPVTRKEMDKKETLLSIQDYMGNGESILVVDDVQEQREIAIRMLTKLGYSPVSVSSGEEAVDYMKRNSANLLVLDMIMPGIDGFETYRRIIEFHPGQKAIIVSGFSETELVRKAQSLGAGAYVRKPYVLAKIGLAIKNELRK